MVLVSDIAGIAAFGYSAWQIGGKWFVFRGKAETREHDSTLFATQDYHCRGKYGSASNASGQPHFFDSFTKLPLPLRVQFVDDVARIAAWSGQCDRSIHNNKPWAELSTKEKSKLLSSLDKLSFDFVYKVKKEGATAASDAWLWQLDESLPLLALEPEASSTPLDAIKELQGSYAPTEAAVHAILDIALANSILLAQSSAEKPLAVTAATRSLQVLKLITEEELGLNLKSIEKMGSDLKTLIAQVAQGLISDEQTNLIKDINSYEASLKQKAEAAAQLVRDDGTATVDAAARKAFVSSLLSTGTSKLGASTLSPGSVAKSNQVADQLAAILSLLSALEDAKEGDAAAEALYEAAKKLLPRFQSTLPPPPSPLASAPAATATETEEGKAEAEEKEKAEEKAEVRPLTLSDLITSFTKGSVAEASALSSTLSSMLISSATPLLPTLPSKPGQAVSDQQVVAELIEGIFRRIKGVPEPIDYKVRAKEIAEEANAKSALEQQAVLSKIETEATSAHAASYQTSISEDLAKASADGSSDELSPASRAFLASHALNKAHTDASDAKSTKESFSKDVIKGLSILKPADLSSLTPPLSQLVNESNELSSLFSLLVKINRQAANRASGLELGPGLTGLLIEVKAILSAPDRLRPLLAAQAPPSAPTPAPSNECSTEASEDTPAADSAPAPAPAVELPIGSVNKALSLVEELLGSSLVVLELQPASYKRLQALRESINGLKTKGMDALSWSKAITNIKEQVGQLGPIGAGVDFRLSDVEDQEHRVLLLELREAAVDLYRRLQQLLADSEMKTASLQGLASIKEGVYSLKVDRKTSLLDATLAKINSSIIEKAAKIRDAISAYSPTAPPSSSATEGQAASSSEAVEAKSRSLAALFSLKERSDALTVDLQRYQQLTRLREQALGPVAPSCPPDVQVPPLFPPLEETQVERAEAAVWLDMSSVPDDDLNSYCMAGYRLVARGQVAVLLICSPEGSEGGLARVSTDIGLPSTKSLLQIFAERMRRIQKLSIEALSGPGSGVMHPLQWCIMASSPAQEAALKSTLESHSYYGLDPEQVTVFYPGDLSVPLLNEDGKIVMESPYKTARVQGGSGEIFRALSQSSVASQLNRAGVRCIDCHAVDDNLLARACDPTFIGYCHSIGLDCAAKVVDPEAEQMTMYGYCHAAGVFKVDGEAEEGPVVQRMPSMVPCTGQYYLAMPWVNKVTQALGKDPLALYHLAPSALPPASHKNFGATGYKFERHLSDFLLPRANAFPSTPSLSSRQCGLVVVDTADEFTLVWGRAPFFAPDSPTAAVEDLLLLHTHWVQSSGGQLGDEEEGVVEVSPLVSYCGEAVEAVVEEGAVFTESYDLTLQGYGGKGKPGASFKTNVGFWMLPVAVAYVAVGALKILGKSK